MKIAFMKIGSMVVAALMVHLIVIDTAFAKPKLKITKSEPTVVTSPLTNIPVEKEVGKESWLSRNKWWVLLGAVAAGGAAAAAAGGGGGGGGDDDNGSSGGGDTGNVTVSWQE